MKHLVKFPLKDGSSVVIEVDAPESEGTVRAGRGDVIIKAKQTLEETFDTILPSVRQITDYLRHAMNGPDEIEVKFGVKISADIGALIASTGVDANFGVTMHWAEKKAGITPQS